MRRRDPRSLPEKRSARKVRLHTSLDAITAEALQRPAARVGGPARVRAPTQDPAAATEALRASAVAGGP